MKAVLRFKLPEEQDEFDHAINGVNYAIVLSDLDNYLRAKLKYENLSEEQNKIYSEIRTKLRELTADRDVEV